MLVPLVLNNKIDHLVFVTSVIVLICLLLFLSSCEMSKMAPTKKLSLSELSPVVVVVACFVYLENLTTCQWACKRWGNVLFNESYCRFNEMQSNPFSYEFYHSTCIALLLFFFGGGRGGGWKYLLYSIVLFVKFPINFSLLS